MTAQPVSMTARKACCHGNPISNYQISSRPLGHKRQKPMRALRTSRFLRVFATRVNKKQDYLTKCNTNSTSK